MLQMLHGGATARPFVTHTNAFDTELYLRIAPELFLKRVRRRRHRAVFEINRNFRNEGVDSTHSPEFAMLEAYQAYGDYDDDGRAHPRSGPGGGTCRVRQRHRGHWPTATEHDLGGQWRRGHVVRRGLRGGRA